ncbi:tyrosine-type recombinase/integrase [Oryzicola mucosus]|uniref:Tyrosine-type recombinase/integrase n=1 Tax=Oryzicola mucosus TaxID=2767425 RepID=A0A8J6PY54_9HYPH|nr:tyrosine-type recombinase/integrase [Oryzicola mucosus]MBD0416528.1 tyrosine-type recombinase/integrase [Oryzicola mucosus]
MAKTVQEAKISTPAARKKLPEGMHWRGIAADLHLGYRKGARGGRWLARWYVGDQKYKQEIIGTADDAVKADGVDCLTFEQAKAAAARLLTQRRLDAAAAEAGPVATVRAAVDAYLIVRDSRAAGQSGRPQEKSDARQRMTKHVMGAEIADIKLHNLKERDLLSWRDGLPSELAASTVRRLINDFKAALNAEAKRHREHLPAETVIVIKNGLTAPEDSSPVARDDQALSDADVRRIVDAAHRVDADGGWEGDLARMVTVLAATGARFSQVVRMKVVDVQTAQSRLMIPTSRKGKGAKASSHIAFRVGEDVIAALRPAIAGRRGADPLLLRWRHKQIKGTGTTPPRWERDERGPWRRAAEMARPWHDITKAAGLPADVVPYALRHSSIVRQLRRGLPVRLVAALHDTSAAMVEAHYSAAIVDALDDLAAGAVIPLISTGGEKVIPLRSGT